MGIGGEDKMKKFYIIVLSALLVLGLSIQARAEFGASAYTGKRYEEQQVLTVAYNSSSSELSKGDVVILDITGTAGSTLGAYVTTTTTADDKYVFGVAHETIGAGAVGTFCVRGPHEVNLENNGLYAAGDIIAASSTEKMAEEYSTSDGTAGGKLGWIPAAYTGTDYSERIAWIDPYVHK